MEQEITILFADVRGFTALSEQMPLKQLRQSLNVMFSACSKILVQNDALVDKFLGDAIMALFNAPIPQPRHREVALQTAIALQEELVKLRLPFPVGIGLNTGVAITGNVGGVGATDYTAIGDSVNVASRLCSLAQKGEILSGISTFEGLSHLLPPGYTRERVSLQLKGKEEPIEAYRIYMAQNP